jgi:hypothetical protein
MSIFEIEIEIEIDKGCFTTRFPCRFQLSIFLHEIDKPSSTLHEIAIEIDKLINIK